MEMFNMPSDYVIKAIYIGNENKLQTRLLYAIITL